MCPSTAEGSAGHGRALPADPHDPGRVEPSPGVEPDGKARRPCRPSVADGAHFTLTG